MVAPLKPHLYPVVLHDTDAVPAGTASNPIVVVGVVSPIGTPVTASKQQNLGGGALSLTSAVAAIWEPRFVTLAFSAPLVGNQTFTVKIKSALGAAYDAVIEQITLAPATSADKQAYVYSFPPDFPFVSGDEIEITLTTGGGETAIVSAVIRGEK